MRNIWIVVYAERRSIVAKNGVSSKTHTWQQLNDYANQHNPNNKAYKAKQQNQASARTQRKREKMYDIGILEGESYGWCDDWLIKSRVKTKRSVSKTLVICLPAIFREKALSLLGCCEGNRQKCEYDT